MTTYVTFAPSQIAAFTFNAVFDGATYALTCFWNTFGQRYYIQCVDQSGNQIFYLPIIGSGNTCFPLASLTWASGTGMGLVTAVTQEPHGFMVGSVAPLVLGGSVPSTYNGPYQCAILSPTAFTYPMANNLGTATALGAVFASVNILAGYFITSTMVYREPLSQFEINP